MRGCRLKSIESFYDRDYSSGRSMMHRQSQTNRSTRVASTALYLLLISLMIGIEKLKSNSNCERDNRENTQQVELELFFFLSCVHFHLNWTRMLVLFETAAGFAIFKVCFHRIRICSIVSSVPLFSCSMRRNCKRQRLYTLISNLRRKRRICTQMPVFHVRRSKRSLVLF